MALRKLKGLINKAKQITVITKSQNEQFKDFILGNQSNTNTSLVILEESFDIDNHKKYIIDSNLLFICTDDTNLNADIESYAKDNNIWNLRCDDASYSDFINPITISNEDLLISISSSGISPVYSKYIKGEIEKLIQNIDTDKLKLIEQARKLIKSNVIFFDDKTALLKQLPDMSKEELEHIIKEESL